MNNKERVLKYLAGLMNAEETQMFESEMNDSAELKSECESAIKMTENLKKLQPSDYTVGYFENLIVRSKLKAGKKKAVKRRTRSYGFALSGAAAAVILFLLIKPEIYNTRGAFDMEEEFQYLSSAEKEELFLKLERSSGDSKLNSIERMVNGDLYSIEEAYYNEIDVNYIDAGAFVERNYGIEELIGFTSEEEGNYILKELQNIKIVGARNE